MAARKITERRAASAARQLLYHRRLTEWISRKTEENEATFRNRGGRACVRRQEALR